MKWMTTLPGAVNEVSLVNRGRLSAAPPGIMVVIVV